MEKAEIKLEKGLNEEVVKKISSLKKEPEWMKEFRLKAYETFMKLPMPGFGPKLDIDFDSIHYYKRITLTKKKKAKKFDKSFKGR